MPGDNTVTDFSPDEARMEAAERVTSILSALPPEVNGPSADSDPPVGIKETLQSYQQYWGAMLLYKRAAEAEIKAGSTDSADSAIVLLRYGQLVATHFDDITTEEIFEQIEIIPKKIQGLIEWMRQNESVSTVPSSLIKINNELEIIEKIHTTTSSPVDLDDIDFTPGSFLDSDL